MKIILWLGLSILSGVLYRIGGTSKGTLWRDIGCSLTTLVACLILGLYVGFTASLVAYLITFGLSWGALASYWGQDEKKFGYFWHGLGLSLAALPIAFITGHWIGFVIRSVVLTGLIVLVSEKFGNVILEEGSRGMLICLTLPLLLI